MASNNAPRRHGLHQPISPQASIRQTNVSPQLQAHEMEPLIPQERLIRPTGENDTPRTYGQQSTVIERSLEAERAGSVGVLSPGSILDDPAVIQASHSGLNESHGVAIPHLITPATSLVDRPVNEDDVQEPLLLLPPPPQYIPVPVTRRPVPSRDSSVHYSVLPGVEAAELPENETVNSLLSTSSRVSHSAHSDQPLWMPLALEWPWMLSIITFGVLLFVVVVIFHSISTESEGAMDDTESSTAYFAWHFLPTLLAVTYVIMLMIIQDAVKRTEGLARLANGRGSSASASILRTPGSWWSALADSFPRKGNGSRFSPVMFSAVLAYILGFLVISPFSSALLSSKDMMISSKTTMLRTQPAPGQTLQPRLGTPEFYASIGHTFQNVDSSPWITDNYTVLPFWPAQIERPSGSRFDAADGDWTAETSVYQTELLCKNLKLQSGPHIVNYTYEPGGILGTGYQNMTSLTLASESGCKYGVSYSSADFGKLGKNLFYWSNVTDVNVHKFWGSYKTRIKFDELLLNHTAQCEAADVFLTVVSVPFTAGYEVVGQLCRQKFFQATLPVTVSLSAGATTFQFDQDDFQRSRIAIDNGNVNITAFHEAFFAPSWDDYLRTSISGTRPFLGGPANLLAAGYDFKVPGLLQDPKFAAKAAKIKQYTFGLALHAALQNISAVTEVEGEIRTRRRRVIVSGGVAITLEVVLSLATLLLVAVFWASRLQRRPLGLSQDIGIPNTVTALIAAQSKKNHDLREISNMSVLDAKHALASYSYTIDHGHLRMSISTPDRSITSSRQVARIRNQERTKWEPIFLSAWAIVGLIFVLTALLITIAVLYWYSRSHGLYQSAFVYETDWSIGDFSLGSIAPYSIVPTLLAVIIGLWWDAVEVHFRTAQPFISMAKGPTTARKGSALSYQSSYLAWAGFRAIKRQHWLLAFVSTGAFLSQILAISMSALWQREPVQLERAIEVSQPFQVRDVPFVYTNATNYKTQTYKGNIMGTVFQSLQSNWMNSASLQISLNASQPPWSSGGWSFVPVSIPASSRKTKQKANPGSDEPQARRAVANVSVPAIRGRLECSIVAKDLEDKFWLTEVNLRKKDYFNETLRPRPWNIGYQLGCGFSDPEINFSPNMTANFTNMVEGGNCSSVGGTTGILTDNIIPSCCAQESENQPEKASIGHWSSVDITKHPPNYKYISQTDNFTVKWIHGPAPVDFTPAFDGSPLLIWPEPPSLAMLNCAPFVETAKASVTVDLETGNIQKYSLLDKPTRHVAAFADDFVARVYNGTTVFNVSASFGTIFVAALLGAAQLDYIGGCVQSSPKDCHEKSNDRTFSYRAPGLNLDYMSYSMLKMAGGDQASMLNHTKLEELAQVTFTTYFQHYASQNVLLNGSGGRAFQRSNETIAADMGPPSAEFDPTKIAPSRVAVAASPSIMATVSQPVEMLRMSPIAVWLCIVILAWLIITTVAILVLKNRYFSPLLGGVETIADVALMVSGSERYLELARREGATGLRANRSFRTRLGWFRSRGGEARWGIELADDDTVHFLSEEEVSLLCADVVEEGEHGNGTAGGGGHPEAGQFRER